MACAAAALCTGLGTSCGYRAVYAGVAPSARLSVGAAPHQVAELPVVHDVLSGTRTELGRAAALSSGSGYPKLLVEVLRVDELASGMALSTDPAGGEHPVARGAAVAVSARGRVLAEPGGEVLSDTGDMRRSAHFAARGDPASDGATRDSALRAASRAVGRALARRTLGMPEPGFEPL